jgi:hypothetical protein
MTELGLSRAAGQTFLGARLLAALVLLAQPALAAGIDSRAYTCAGLQALVAQRGFVFISQATFGDFVVANGSYCAGGQIVQLRSVLTSDQPECPVNYCTGRSSSAGGGM